MSRCLTGNLVVTAIFLSGFAFLSSPALAGRTASYILSDYGKTHGSFDSFRIQLLDAVKRHDKKFVEDMLSPNVETGLGAGTGKAEFNKQWENLVPTSPFWERMQRVLGHGAEYEKDSGRVQAPATNFDDTKLSDSIQAIVWNKDAILSDAPSESAKVIERLYDDQVTVLKPDQPEPIHDRWVKVKTQKGKTGFMKSDDIFSAYDEFAEFKQMNGKWKLVFFGIAGL